MIIMGLLIASAKGTGTHIHPQNEPTTRYQFQSIHQHLRHLVKSGLPYARAVTRLMSDTPVHIKLRSEQGRRPDGIIKNEMTRLREEGMPYGRAATLSVDSDRIPTCQARNTKDKQEEKRTGRPGRQQKGNDHGGNQGKRRKQETKKTKKSRLI